MKRKNIARFVYEDIEYHIQHDIFNYQGENISIPFFFITTKSSMKKRDKNKFISKNDGHHQLVNLKNPFPLIKKIYSLMELELRNFNYVCFIPHEDKEDKRGRVYSSYLNKMGFEILYKNPDSSWHFLGRKGHKMKKKEINSLLWAIYNEESI